MPNFFDNISSVSKQTIKTLSESKKDIDKEFKGIVDFCLDNISENVDSFEGNGYTGNGFDGNGFAGNGFEDFGGNGFEEFCGNGFEGNGFNGNGYEGNGIGGNGADFLENYNFDDDINNLWQEG